MKLPKHLPCPCHNQKSYGFCCGPYHEGKVAMSPSALMRSRYSAYALNLADYIQKTTHPQSPLYQENTQKWRDEILAFCKGTQFVGLEILEVGEGTITFRASLVQKGEDTSFTEKSGFKQEGGRWFYLGPEPNGI